MLYGLAFLNFAFGAGFAVVVPFLNA